MVAKISIYTINIILIEGIIQKLLHSMLVVLNLVRYILYIFIDQTFCAISLFVKQLKMMGYVAILSMIILAIPAAISFFVSRSISYGNRMRLQVINRVTPGFEVSINLGLLGWADGQTYVNGELTVNFNPWIASGSSKLVQERLPLPLGIDVEQSEEDGMIKITGIADQGSVTTSGANVQIGDVLRALTAREKRMVYPRTNVALGGIGRPQLVTSFLPLKKGVPLDLVLAAMKSNLETNPTSDDPYLRSPGEITLILERKI